MASEVHITSSGGQFRPDRIQTPAQITALGQARESIVRIIVLGIILGILTIGVVLGFLLKVEGAKEMWTSVNPIIYAGMGFLAGQKLQTKK